MKRRFTIVLMAVILLIGLTACNTTSTTNVAGANEKSNSSDKLQGSNRFERNGWVYVHLEGAPDKKTRVA